jgi:hypothetical protein
MPLAERADDGKRPLRMEQERIDSYAIIAA